jgi:hypothetical protein
MYAAALDGPVALFQPYGSLKPTGVFRRVRTPCLIPESQ